MDKQDIDVGRIVEISLDDNSGSTGYDWMLVDLPNNLYLVDVDRTPATSPLLGAPGKKVFKLIGARAGSGKVAFVLARPFQLGSPAQRATYDVKVR